jgi:CHASE3 domain sensor protein
MTMALKLLKELEKSLFDPEDKERIETIRADIMAKLKEGY